MHKHAVLLQVLQTLTAAPARMTVVDTHAGAGVYDLEGAEAQRSAEAQAGIARLLAEPRPPGAFAPLRAAVQALNRRPQGRLYPGSPLLIAGGLREGDRYVGCELRADDYQALSRVLAEHSRAAGPQLQALNTDGFAAAPRLARLHGEGRALLLIDPPYERGDDHARMVETLTALARGGPPTPALIWAPIKDLETYDALLRRLESLPYSEGWSAEARLRPLTNPMRLNGSAMIGLGLPPPPGLKAICDWAAASAGERGAEGRATLLFC